MIFSLGALVLRMLPKLILGQVSLHHEQEAGCIYVNNVGPWNAKNTFAITVLIERDLGL